MGNPHNNAFIALMLTQMIAGSTDNPYRADDLRKSKFDTEGETPKPHNRPEPKEHTYGTEPKPRSKRKIWREELKRKESSDEPR